MFERGISLAESTGGQIVGVPNVVAICEASKNWKSIHHWKPALHSFRLMFGEERVPLDAL